jgi:antitoxin component HigA of HigAB toxin-antitoxin module
MDKIIESTKRIAGQLESSRTKVTTFRITKDSVDAMEWLCDRYEITMKDLFNQIIGDEFFLTTIKDMVDDSDSKNGQIVKKTQRMAYSTLNRLNRFAKKYGVSRDVLVQTTFLVLKESEINQIEAKRDVHAKALKEIDSHVELSKKTKKKLQALVGRKDSIYNRFDSIIIMLNNLSNDISLELNEGKPINPKQS